MIHVVKKDNTKEEFNVQKVVNLPAALCTALLPKR